MKQKLLNPQIFNSDIDGAVELTEENVGVFGLSKEQNSLVFIGFDESNKVAKKTLVDIDYIRAKEEKFFTDIISESSTIIKQVSGDQHFEEGYDFFSDRMFITVGNAIVDRYFSYFYVKDNLSKAFDRVIGADNVRRVTGHDYFGSDKEQIVKYTKIKLQQKAKKILYIDYGYFVIDSGFALSEDGSEIYIYFDPHGVFLGHRVKVRYYI